MTRRRIAEVDGIRATSGSLGISASADLQRPVFAGLRLFAVTVSASSSGAGQRRRHGGGNIMMRVRGR